MGSKERDNRFAPTFEISDDNWCHDDSNASDSGLCLAVTSARNENAEPNTDINKNLEINTDRNSVNLDSNDGIIEERAGNLTSAYEEAERTANFMKRNSPSLVECLKTTNDGISEMATNVSGNMESKVLQKIDDSSRNEGQCATTRIPLRKLRLNFDFSPIDDDNLLLNFQLKPKKIITYKIQPFNKYK